MALFRYSGKRLAEAYKREPLRGIQTWAEQEVIFTDLDVSPVLGNFKVKISPHYKKLFQLIDRTLTRELFAKWASQSGKSLFGVLVAAHKLDTLPATVIYAQPLKDDVSTILQTKINPVLKSIPKLWKKFEDYKETEKIRTKDAAKKLAGGNFLVKGSSTKDRKSQTSPFIVLDEIGEFEEGAVFEFKERTKSFTKFHPKVVGVSTIVHPQDEICANFDACSVKIEWHYICMKCKDHFYPDISLFKFKTKRLYIEENGLEKADIVLNKYIDEAKATVHIECPHCSYKINTAEKDRMIAKESMDWFIKHENGTYEILEIDNLTTETSFGADMNSFGSFFVTFEDIVENIIKAGHDEIKLDKLYRGWFNRFYQKEIKTTESSDLLLLGNGLPKWEVPEDTIKIYMGVDTQKDHFWFEIKAYTYGNRSHSIAFGRLETFEDVERIWELGQNLVSEHGEVFQIDKMGIDRRGYNQDGINRTAEVDVWLRKMIQKWRRGDENRIYGTEGEPKITGDAPYKIAVRKDDTDNRVKVDIKVLKLSNIYLKTMIRTAMSNTIDMAKSEHPEDYEDVPHFFVNQTTIDADASGTVATSYTRQISVEVYDFGRDKNGKLHTEKSFINPKQADNHIFDTSVICEGFAQKDQVFMERKPVEENIEDALNGMDDW